MRKRNLIIALFIAGCAMLIPFYGIIWGGWSDTGFGILIFIAILGVAAILGTIGITAKGRCRNRY